MNTHVTTKNSFDISDRTLLSLCKASLRLEAAAIADYSETLGNEFLAALKILRDAREPVVVAGIGKSGHIARKIASTFRSIGRSAVFLHAAEASHGDLGLVGPQSAVVVLSNSGETAELSDLIRYCNLNAVPMIAIVSNAESTLGKHSDVVLAYGTIEEACPNGLAPTTSTTLALAIGDALAVGLVRMIGTTPEDFRRYHPGGKLGAKLLRVCDIMHMGDSLPIVDPDLMMQEVVITMSAKGFGVALVVEDEAVCGIITDGDMRRNVDRLWQSRARDVSLGKPLSIEPDCLASEALEIMSANGITCLPVEDQGGKLLGLVHVHDCLRAGVSQ
ncbi:arabinose-5-phosphate isomerase [Mesorhizobium sp. J18]|uniref:KpsF/GutQ family sugar-phosphate isomerase n=1 Tax=Mesorhizobium sp. J18 TaxID=935263 RepID=UPI00119BB890|nr:KpsF/GutQ family sugar-phosphate isomerase [Mesorhizobium sp. J18]TWG99907.1 arabinose-5-phosphate isomerase [Mesorhizobium sp. J18]